MCEAMGRQCNDKPRHARVRIGASRQPRVSALLRHSLHGRRSACNHSLAVCTAQGLGCGCRGVGRATVSSLHGNPGQRPTARLHAGMVSHVQREQGGNAGNDGGEANAGTGAADRGASPSFAEVEAFFAERQEEHLAKASQAYSFCFTQERALQGDWQWQAATADGFTPASLDAPLHPEEVPAGAARPSVGAQTPTKCRPAVSQDPELPESRTPALKAKRARADVQPLKLTLRLRSSGSP